MTKTVVGLYEDYQEAENTVRDLVDNGFRRDDISFIAQDATHGNQPSMHTGEETQHDSVAGGAAAGAGTGAVLGGLAGLVIGLGALAIPGIGPIIAAGPLATALAGAGVGVVAGGLIGALVDAGIPHEQAEAYAEGVRRGGTLVTLRAADDRANLARDIMNSHHPIDLADRSHEWRSQGISEGPANTSPYATSGMQTSHANYESSMSGQGTGSDFETQGMTGDMSVMDRERMMDEMQGTTSGQQGTFGRDRDMANQPGSFQSSQDIAYGEDTLRDRDITDQGTFQGSQSSEFDRGISEHDRDMANQGTFQGNEDFTDRGTFQSDRDMATQEDYTGIGHGDWETRDVNRIVGGAGHTQGQNMMGQRDFDSFNDEFRDHYMLIYSARGYKYDFYEPGYRYGYEAANSDRYQGRKWSEIEPELQRNWQQTNPNNPWDDFRDAVRYGWERTTGSGEMRGSTGQDMGPSSSQDYGSGTTLGGYDPNNP